MGKSARNIQLSIPEQKWTAIRSQSTAVKCLIGVRYYLRIGSNVNSAMHRKAALDLTLLPILSKAIKPSNAGIHVRNVGAQYSGIAVQLCKNIQNGGGIRQW